MENSRTLRRRILRPRTRIQQDVPHVEDIDFRLNVLQQPTAEVRAHYHQRIERQNMLFFYWSSGNHYDRMALAGLLQNTYSHSLVYLEIYPSGHAGMAYFSDGFNFSSNFEFLDNNRIVTTTYAKRHYLRERLLIRRLRGVMRE
jgi:hypothetical protein